MHSYPNIKFNSPLLPLPLSNLSKILLTSSWSLTTTPSSSYTFPSTSDIEPLDVSALEAVDAKANIAMDIFLDSDPKKATNTTEAAYEVMIWFGTVGQPLPIGNTNDQKECQIGRSNYILSTGTNSASQTVFTFLSTQNQTISKTTDVSPFLTYLYHHAFLPSDNFYLGTLQFGTETFHSTSGVSLIVQDDFKIELIWGRPQENTKWDRRWLLLPIGVLLLVGGALAWWFRGQIAWRISRCGRKLGLE